MTPRRLTGLAVGIAATVLVPFVSLDRFIFFPDRNVPPPPPGVRERWLTTAAGMRLHAEHAVASEARAARPAVPSARVLPALSSLADVSKHPSTRSVQRR